MVTLSRQVESWGTVILFELSTQKVSKEKLIQAFSEAEKFIYHVDEVFSTYKENSIISQLKREEIEISSCSHDVQEVWGLCKKAMELTEVPPLMRPTLKVVLGLAGTVISPILAMARPSA